MITVADYFNGTEQEQEDERKRRGWTPRPPAAHTHRGKARTWEMDGHHEATKPKRAPTHRKPGPAVVPANVPPWVRMLQAHADQAERSRDA